MLMASQLYCGTINHIFLITEMKKKPSKQAGIKAKNESNKGDSKGELNPKVLTPKLFEQLTAKEREFIINHLDQLTDNWIEKESELLTESEEKEILTIDQIKKIRILLEQQDKASKKLTPQRIKELLNDVRKNNEGKKAYQYKSESEVWARALTPEKNELRIADEVISILKPKLEREKKFDQTRKPDEPPKPRDRKHPKKEVFFQWVKDYDIDFRLSLGELHLEVDEAYRMGVIKIKIGRSTVNECIQILRDKK